jgi:RNA polymerase sigma factor (sigma-70 family)
MRVLTRPSRLPPFAPPDPRPDAVLLARFTLHGDEGAFTTLVLRHTPMVRAVCGGWLRCRADVDDAAQATFLVLVKRAGSIREANKLGAWLGRTAVLVARRLKKQLGRSAPLVTDPPERGANEQDHRAEAVAAEVALLPEKYRLPVQLHYAGGLSTADIAERLGWPKGTVLTRLDRGRKLLERRLLARGVTAGVLAGVLNVDSVSAGWVHDTARAAVALAAGLPASGATDRAVSLSQGVVNAMTWTKLRVLLAVLMMSVGVGGFALGQWATDKKKPEAGEKVAVPAKAEEPAAPKPAKPDESKPATGRRKEAVIKLPTGTFAKDIEVAPYGSGRLSWTFEDEKVLGKIEASIPVMGVDVELHTEAEYSLSSSGTIYGVVTSVKLASLKVNEGLFVGADKGAAEQFKAILGMVKAAEPLIAEMFTDLPFSYQFRLTGDRLVILNYRTLLAGPNPLMKVAPLLGGNDALGELAQVTMGFQMLSTAIEGTYTASDGEEEPKKKPAVGKSKTK